MRIIETEINDICVDNIEESKINLVNEIINYVQPIFTDEYKEKVHEIKSLKSTLVDNQERIKKEKDELTNLFNIFSKKNKEKVLLNKMGKLIHTGLIQESMKNEMTVLLNSFDRLPEEKITSYLNETIVLLSQKFAKS